MHSGARGKSGSKRPAKHVPGWAPYKENEVEKLAVKYAKAGKSPSEIGLILRDSYGINSVQALTNKKLGAILQEHHVAKKLPEDLLALIKRMIAIRQHLEKNKHDEFGQRGLILVGSKIRRLVKYYKKNKKISVDWKLDTGRLKMYLE